MDRLTTIFVISSVYLTGSTSLLVAVLFYFIENFFYTKYKAYKSLLKKHCFFGYRLSENGLRKTYSEAVFLCHSIRGFSFP